VTAKKKKPPLSEKQRAKAEALRESHRHFEVAKFGQLLKKAIRPRRPPG
jgi:hypothetical protein